MKKSDILHGRTQTSEEIICNFEYDQSGISSFKESLDSFKRIWESMDLAHGILIYGHVVASKPENILELGIGTGFITRMLLSGIEYNNFGKLTCVDNWLDTNGVEPNFTKELKDRGAKIICSDEQSFCYNAKKDEYDMLISDADHDGDWSDFHLLMVKNNGLMFFHDTNNPEFKALSMIENKVKKLGCPTYHFAKSTRGDERCERGLLLVINRK